MGHIAAWLAFWARLYLYVFIWSVCMYNEMWIMYGWGTYLLYDYGRGLKLVYIMSFRYKISWFASDRQMGWGGSCHIL